MRRARLPTSSIAIAAAGGEVKVRRPRLHRQARSEAKVRPDHQVRPDQKARPADQARPARQASPADKARPADKAHPADKARLADKARPDHQARLADKARPARQAPMASKAPKAAVVKPTKSIWPIGGEWNEMRGDANATRRMISMATYYPAAALHLPLLEQALPR